jgi:hypothetical protein
MNFIPKKIAKNILLAACLIGSGTSYASIFNFTSKNGGLGHSFTETSDGVTIKVSAFKFSGSNSTPSNAGAQSTFIQGYGKYGLGIGPNRSGHTANNTHDNREFFLVEFDQLVKLGSASISEWGNNYGSRYGGDSDIDYWGGTGAFNFDNLGTLFGDNVSSGLLRNGQTRNIMFDSGLGNISWLLLGPEAFNSSNSNNVHDFIKLRNIGYDVAAVPLPATVWLMGSALLGLGGLKRKRG